ncbi:uncharacterized protein LOC132735083 [Ruditapes philippinarum]|uniref:uncharacterized protein LOC132735083 n=1 Tax=Ruditapes philippinarum TaxID=129788 RepID=UPI00295AFBA7|nr:uncharacterized protein LOC132735083 [Ruditapes philippinarum]
MLSKSATALAGPLAPHGLSAYKPYQLVRQKSGTGSNNIVTKFIVRRIPIVRDKHSKLLSLGSTSLKFKLFLNKKPLSGYRIINLENLKDHVAVISTHSCICEKARALAANGKPPIILRSEKCKSGLFSILLAICEGCKQEFCLNTSQKQGNGQYDINVRAVWGTMASGGGATDIREQLSTMNIPQLTSNMFSSLEDQIGKWWEDALKEEMGKAGAEERRIAIEKGNFHDGIPAITVICDGGWSKRTYKHTYNAYGGVGVIFGAETKKLLYIGVRNKHCVICKQAKNKTVEPKSHNCYKNWSESSQAMEADIILNGFLQAETSHGVRYTKIIADGDSSVFPQLQEKVPVWGTSIEKLECANHTCKCLRSNLEKLVIEKPHYKGKGKLTKINRLRLTTAVRCAIRMRSKDQNVKQLRKDIINSVYHVLGFHDRCSDFCKKKVKHTMDNDGDDNDNELNFDNESFDDIFESQYEYWKLPSEKEMESSRHASKNKCQKSELKELVKDVQFFLNRIADKSHRLIGNFTINLCESWMAIRAKFDGGKVINRCSRGSWNARCYGGALRKNIGVEWSPITFNHVTKEPAGVFFLSGVRRQAQLLNASSKYKAKPDSKNVRRKRKLEDIAVNNSKKAKLHYGSNLDDSPDVSQSKLKELCDNFLKSQVKISDTDILNIQNNTIDQSLSDTWRKERNIRLTSSNFGKVMARRSTNVSSALVKNMLYSKFQGNIHTIRGLTQEQNTIIEYKNQKGNVEVSKTGLKICKSHPYLAASTDGIVQTKSDTGLLEIKNLLQTNSYMIKQAIGKVQNFCLQQSNNKVQLKREHEYYFQIQGQLNIFEIEWCDFVIRRTNPYDLYIERIKRDKNLWTLKMVPKLKCFYMKFILPELSLPRYGTYTGIRQPEKPWVGLIPVRFIRCSKCLKKINKKIKLSYCNIN